MQHVAHAQAAATSSGGNTTLCTHTQKTCAHFCALYTRALLRSVHTRTSALCTHAHFCARPHAHVPCAAKSPFATPARPPLQARRAYQAESSRTGELCLAARVPVPAHATRRRRPAADEHHPTPTPMPMPTPMLECPWQCVLVASVPLQQETSLQKVFPVPQYIQNKWTIVDANTAHTMTWLPKGARQCGSRAPSSGLGQYSASWPPIAQR
jgi:hypothetical protein